MLLKISKTSLLQKNYVPLKNFAVNGSIREIDPIFPGSYFFYLIVIFKRKI